MNTYKVKLVSQTNAILLIILVLIVFFVKAAIFFPVSNRTLAVALILFDFCIAYLLWQKFVTGRTEWTVDNNEIKIIWTKQFAFANDTNYTLPWSEIDNISQGRDTHYYNLKIKLTNGQTLKFYHDTLTTKDDFEELLKVLYQTLKEKKAPAPTGSGILPLKP
jgi:hypothetical protein